MLPREKLDQALAPRGMAQSVNDDERALALGDVAPEILFLSLSRSDQVEQVVLDLERKTRIEAERAQTLDDFLVRAPTIAPTARGTAPE